MIVELDDKEGFTDRLTGKELTQLDIDAALNSGEKVFLSLFGGSPVELVQVETVIKVVG